MTTFTDQSDQRIKSLLGNVLKDDLPPGVEHNMLDQLRQFQDRLGAERSRPRISAVLLKAALVAAGVLMVLIGGFLQAAGRQNIMTENISLVGMTVRVSDLVANSTSMLCSVELQQENGETRGYLVRWLSPGLLRVDVRPTHQEASHTIWKSEEETVVVDYAEGSVQEFNNMDSLIDPVIPSLIALLTPERLSEVLYGEWQLRRQQKAGACEWKTFAVIPPHTGDFMEMTVDLCAYLPIEIQKQVLILNEGNFFHKGKLKIKLQWNAPIQPQDMVPSSLYIKKNV